LISLILQHASKIQLLTECDELFLPKLLTPVVLSSHSHSESGDLLVWVMVLLILYACDTVCTQTNRKSYLANMSP